MARKKVGISERALIQRINRKLAPDGEKLCTARGRTETSLGGRYYVVNIQRNFVTQHGFELEDMARELGALRPWEAIED